MHLVIINIDNNARFFNDLGMDRFYNFIQTFESYESSAFR